MTPSAPSSWHESISDLKQLLDDESSHVKIEKLCAKILELHSQSDDNSNTLPDEVKEVVTTIHLRALLHSRRYSDVTATNDDNSINVLEQAYALYRLKKYEACQNLCSEYLKQNDNCRGIMHIHAQALYRMGETCEADGIYSKLLEEELDTDEKEDVLANALANRTANYTRGSMLSENFRGAWMENVEDIVALLQSYGKPREDDDILQNYDLAYNLATYLLVSADARPRSSVVQAKQLLTHAEKSALTVFEASKADSQDESDADAAKIKQQKLLAEKEAMPIRANLAYANLLLGGDDNIKDALRTYLTFVMEENKKRTCKGSVAGIEANLLATASNNLALLRDGKESVFDVLKRIPTATSYSVSEDAGGGKCGKSSTSGIIEIPLVGATPQQVRAVLFNRALQLAKMGNTTRCLETLAILRASLDVSYRGDDEDNENGKASGSPKAKAKNKKSLNKSNHIESSTLNRDVPTAKPCSELEAIAWNARADWLQSELRRIVASDEKSPEDITNSAISTLDSATKSVTDEAAGALSYMKAQLLLQNAAVINENGPTKAQSLITVLESLPPVVQVCPGMMITLAWLHGASHKEASVTRSVEILSCIGKSITAQLTMAKFYLERNQYNDAITILKSILDNEDSVCADEKMSTIALLVHALSFTNPDKAIVYAETLREAYEDSEIYGEEFENMEIPRFAKKALVGESASSSKLRKIMASTSGKRGAIR